MDILRALYDAVHGAGEMAYNNIMFDMNNMNELINGRRSIVDSVGARLGYDGSVLDDLGTRAGLSQSDKNQIEYALSGVPYVGDVIRARDGYNYVDDYLRNNDLTWADVKYPSRVTGSGAIGTSAMHSLGGVRQVSRNVEQLYADSQKKKYDKWVLDNW